MPDTMPPAQAENIDTEEFHEPWNYESSSSEDEYWAEPAKKKGPVSIWDTFPEKDPGAWIEGYNNKRKADAELKEAAKRKALEYVAEEKKEKARIAAMRQAMREQAYRERHGKGHRKSKHPEEVKPEIYDLRHGKKRQRAAEDEDEDEDEIRSSRRKRTKTSKKKPSLPKRNPFWSRMLPPATQVEVAKPTEAEEATLATLTEGLYFQGGLGAVFDKMARKAWLMAEAKKRNQEATARAKKEKHLDYEEDDRKYLKAVEAKMLAKMVEGKPDKWIEDEVLLHGFLVDGHEEQVYDDGDGQGVGFNTLISQMMNDDGGEDDEDDYIEEDLEMDDQIPQAPGLDISHDQFVPKSESESEPELVPGQFPVKDGSGGKIVRNQYLVEDDEEDYDDEYEDVEMGNEIPLVRGLDTSQDQFVPESESESESKDGSLDERHSSPFRNSGTPALEDSSLYNIDFDSGAEFSELEEPSSCVKSTKTSSVGDSRDSTMKEADASNFHYSSSSDGQGAEGSQEIADRDAKLEKRALLLSKPVNPKRVTGFGSHRTSRNVYSNYEDEDEDEDEEEEGSRTTGTGDHGAAHAEIVADAQRKEDEAQQKEAEAQLLKEDEAHSRKYEAQQEQEEKEASLRLKALLRDDTARREQKEKDVQKMVRKDEAEARSKEYEVQQEQEEKEACSKRKALLRDYMARREQKAKAREDEAEAHLKECEAQDLLRRQENAARPEDDLARREKDLTQREKNATRREKKLARRKEDKKRKDKAKNDRRICKRRREEEEEREDKEPKVRKRQVDGVKPWPNDEAEEIAKSSKGELDISGIKPLTVVQPSEDGRKKLEEAKKGIEAWTLKLRFRSLNSWSTRATAGLHSCSVCRGASGYRTDCYRTDYRDNTTYRDSTDCYDDRIDCSEESSWEGCEDTDEAMSDEDSNGGGETGSDSPCHGEAWEDTDEAMSDEDSDGSGETGSDSPSDGEDQSDSVDDGTDTDEDTNDDGDQSNSNASLATENVDETVVYTCLTWEQATYQAFADLAVLASASRSQEMRFTISVSPPEVNEQMHAFADFMENGSELVRVFRKSADNSQYAKDETQREEMYRRQQRANATPLRAAVHHSSSSAPPLMASSSQAGPSSARRRRSAVQDASPLSLPPMISSQGSTNSASPSRAPDDGDEPFTLPPMAPPWTGSGSTPPRRADARRASPLFIAPMNPPQAAPNPPQAAPNPHQAAPNSDNQSTMKEETMIQMVQIADGFDLRGMPYPGEDAARIFAKARQWKHDRDLRLARLGKAKET